jgi:hypothetical protein
LESLSQYAPADLSGVFDQLPASRWSEQKQTIIAFFHIRVLFFGTPGFLETGLPDWGT